MTFCRNCASRVSRAFECPPLAFPRNKDEQTPFSRRNEEHSLRNNRPVVEYTCIAWPKLSAHLRNRLERFQRRASKVILRKPLFEPSDHDEVLLTLQQPSLESRRQYQSAIIGFQLANKTAPQHLLNECFPPASPARSLRQRNHFNLPTPHTTLYQSSPIYFAARTFNELPKTPAKHKKIVRV